MTESEWLASEDPTVMLRWVTSDGSGPGEGPNRIPTSDRKLRLFALQCWWDGFSIEPMSDHWRGVRAWGDAWIERGCPRHDAEQLRLRSGPGLPGTGWLLLAPDPASAALSYSSHHRRDGMPRQTAALLRDVVGNPFRPVTLHALFASRDVVDECLRLARTAYDEQQPDGLLDPARLAVLSDALEEAGFPPTAGNVAEVERGIETLSFIMARCTSDAAYRGYQSNLDGMYVKLREARQPHPLLAHLRSPGPHARGCWALDLILGKG